MSFLQELGKGFIRSAVNQVGRDGGKVISNKIYGDAHATPIRRVGQSTSGTYFDTETNQQLTPQQILQYATTDGWTPRHSSYTWAHRITLMALAIFIGSFPMIFPFSLVLPIVPLYLIYRGIKKIRQRHTTYFKLISRPTFKADKRYKGCIRATGEYETQELTIQLTSNEDDKRIQRRLGLAYILCAIIMYISAYYIGTSWMNITPANDDGIVTEQVNDTIQ